MKNYVLLFFLCLMLASCTPNPELENKAGYNDFMYLSFINNKNIGYDKNKPEVLLDSNEKEIAKILIKSTWTWLLHKDTSDFAANIILYQVFKSDTTFSLYYKSINDWTKYQKTEDIIFWDSFLQDPKK